MVKKILLALFIGLLALGGGIMVRQQQLSKNDFPTSDITQRLAEINLPDLAGKNHALSEWQGRLIILNFWATWCPPCREEIPEFIQLQTHYADKGLQFIGIAVDDNLPVADFVRTSGINYPVLLAPNEGPALAEQLGNSAGALPYTLIIDQHGNIIHLQFGRLTREKIESVIKPLLR